MQHDDTVHPREQMSIQFYILHIQFLFKEAQLWTCIGWVKGGQKQYEFIWKARWENIKSSGVGLLNSSDKCLHVRKCMKILHAVMLNHGFLFTHFMLFFLNRFLPHNFLEIWQYVSRIFVQGRCCQFCSGKQFMQCSYFYSFIVSVVNENSYMPFLWKCSIWRTLKTQRPPMTRKYVLGFKVLELFVFCLAERLTVSQCALSTGL